jgi:hypothetical protein
MKRNSCQQNEETMFVQQKRDDGERDSGRGWWGPIATIILIMLLCLGILSIASQAYWWT